MNGIHHEQVKCAMCVMDGFETVHYEAQFERKVLLAEGYRALRINEVKIV